jgi:hypothetical protein
MKAIKADCEFLVMAGNMFYQRPPFMEGGSYNASQMVQVSCDIMDYSLLLGARISPPTTPPHRTPFLRKVL